MGSMSGCERVLTLKGEFWVRLHSNVFQVSMGLAIHHDTTCQARAKTLKHSVHSRYSEWQGRNVRETIYGGKVATSIHSGTCATYM